MKVKPLTNRKTIDSCLKIRFLGIHVLLMLLSLSAFSQTVITGTIRSVEDEEGLPGATVVIKGTTTGVTTDITGNFKINAGPSDILSISFIGFESQEILVGSQTEIIVVLSPDIATLNEVVVLGYSEKSQKEISASVVSLKMADLQSVTSGNVQTMLQGKVAGLTVNSSSGAPGATPDIRLRGITSINADRSPLLVVDGMIGGNYVPSDIETITVLKDASAIGLYGSLGAAGVIIITTRQAKSATPEFSFTTSYGIKEITTGNFRMMNGQELYDAQRIMWGDDFVGFLSNRPEELEDQNFDWLGAGFGQAVIQNYNFSARGKDEKLAYTFNVDYFNEEGTFVNTDFERLNLRTSIKFNPSDKFSFGTAINAQYSENQTEHYSWFEDAFYSLPWDNPYYDDGSTKFVNSQEFAFDPNQVWYGQFRRNFLNSTGKNTNESASFDLQWSFRFKLKLTDWLSLETRTRFNANNSTFSVFQSPETHEGIAANGIVLADKSSGAGVLSTHFLRFGKTFGLHDFSAFIAHEGASSYSDPIGFAAQNLAPTIKVPSGATTYNSIYGAPRTFAGISYIGEVTYGYNDRYFATLVYRRDGSDGFAENKKYANFPSASVAWLLSEEGFMKNSAIFETFKLRLSHGLVGNDGRGGGTLPAFAFLPTYDITRQYNGQPGGDPNNPENDDLGWETTKLTNLGLDFGFLNGDLLVNIDVYNKEVEGMLFANPQAWSQGYQFKWENIGSMRNQGVELALNYQKALGDNWSYSGNFNISYNDNEITFISDVTDEQTLASGPILQVNRVGLEAFTWNMPRWIGVDPSNGLPVWEQILPDGSAVETSDYNEATFQPIESALPTMTGGMSNSLSYKGLSLSFLMTFQTGNYIYNNTREFVDSDGANTGVNLMVLQDGWSRWEEPGDIATHPILTRGDTDGSHFTSSRYLEKGDYVRLRNVRLAYSLPSSLLSKAKIKSATLSLSADNLFTSTKFSGMDPDINMGVGPFQLPGLSFLKYPISKQYILGLTLNF